MNLKYKKDYSDETHELIKRMCEVVERKSFRLNQKKAEELLLKTYDLFDLPRPKKVIWCKDIFDDQFERSTRPTWSVRSARSVRSAGSAWSAWSAGSTSSARSAWSAGSAWSWIALDYDFDWFVVEHEYVKNRQDNPGDEPNENDYKYLEYSELLIQAKEAGAGYWVEWENTLYLSPTPLVLIDSKNRFHSADKPAIRWKGGKELFYLNGVSFDKKLWKQVVNKKLTAKELLAINNIEQRMTALKTYGVESIVEELGAKTVDIQDGYELFEVRDVFSSTQYALKYTCPSTDRVYFKWVDPQVAQNKDALEAIASTFGLSKEEYKNIRLHA